MTGEFVLMVHGCQPSMTVARISYIIGVKVALDPPICAEIIYDSLQVLQILSNL